MPRAQVGTPKYLANAMKSKGLQRLRWYCQVCQKQCRDENGFKCHSQSESHLRQMLVVGENAGAHISSFSSEFQHEFVQLLSRRFTTTRVHANRVYQELIQDKHHMHMNATRWVTLTEFVKHLGRSGIARVDETEKGWFIQWIDNTPKALAKQEATQKKERATMSDEQRERALIAEQIARAEAEKKEKEGSVEGDEDKPAVEEGLKRNEGEKVKLSFSMKPAADKSRSTSPPNASTSDSSTTAASSPSSASTDATATAPPTTSSTGLKLGFKPATAGNNPLKRPNVFKMAAAKANAEKEKQKKKTDEKTSAAGQKRVAEMSAAERLIIEDQERKRRKMERDAVRS